VECEFVAGPLLDPACMSCAPDGAVALLALLLVVAVGCMRLRLLRSRSAPCHSSMSSTDTSQRAKNKLPHAKAHQSAVSQQAKPGLPMPLAVVEDDYVIDDNSAANPGELAIGRVRELVEVVEFEVECES
jgi:hypothetical protein